MLPYRDFSTKYVSLVITCCYQLHNLSITLIYQTYGLFILHLFSNDFSQYEINNNMCISTMNASNVTLQVKQNHIYRTVKVEF